MLDFEDYYREIEEILCLYEFIFLMFFIGFVNNLFKKKDFGNVFRFVFCELLVYDLQIKEKFDKRKEMDSLILIWSISIDFLFDDKNKCFYDMVYLSYNRFWVVGNSNVLFLFGLENYIFDVMQMFFKVKYLIIFLDGVLYYINGINNMIYRIINEGSFEVFISIDIWKFRDIVLFLIEGIYVSLFRSKNLKVVYYKKFGEI